ncbi:MAG: iron-containing alcohol dehydrogenase [Defluviitaleaceae bacterium]|nr:iron-containing alcohol dehydrogenase [Defluviitaleaceae bacterium]
MLNFQFYSPTEVVFGRGAEARAGEMVRKYGGSRVIVVYGEGSVVRSGALAGIVAQLEEANLAVLQYGGATPNPHLSFAREGVRRALEFGADFVLAVGGGSAIDAAKAIAHGVANPETDIWQFWTQAEKLTRSTPVGVVLTISAAGSETSMSAVLTNTEAGLKRGLGTDFNRPKFALMNPEFTFTIPRYHLACGIADIFMHTLDRYFAQENINDDTPSETTDALAAAILRTVIRNAPRVLADSTDYHAQSEIMWCGSLSHNTITGLGRTMDFSVHQLGHELSGKFDVAHGASLTTMWGAWARFVMEKNPPTRMAHLWRNVYATGEMKDIAQEGCADANNASLAKASDDMLAERAIIATEQFFRQIEMPTNFTKLGIGVQQSEVLDALAESCVFFGKRKVGSYYPLDKADVLAVYTAANK